MWVFGNTVEPIIITKNTTVYARGINSKGVTKRQLEITNIGKEATPPPLPEKLNIQITANPESTSNNLVNKTLITIDYDPKATEKKYRLGTGEEKDYIGPFELTMNTTIYASAYSENGYGTKAKAIDFLTMGIADPIISSNVPNTTSATSEKISIYYDSTASIRKYKLDNGPWQDYAGEFTVDKNVKITAYNKNMLGYEATSTYEVTNIMSPKPPLILDKGSYFLLKLNYPTDSTEMGREYKWSQDGTWKKYPSSGILLIKSEYQNEVLDKNGLKIKIEDDNGNLIDFTGDYYLLDIPISEIMENIFMRWDVSKPKNPTIKTNPTSPAKTTTVIINYDDRLTSKYYKYIDDKGTDNGWKEYTKEFEVKQNGIVFAYGITQSQLETDVVKYEIKNIDNIPPEILITGDFETPKNKINAVIKAIDNLGIEAVGWMKGKKTIETFQNEGIFVDNNSSIKIDENGIYTFYAKDKVGNESIIYQEITNIDKTKPLIEISILTKTFGTKAEIEINYGNSINKTYKIGENSQNWISYTGTFNITSQDVLKNSARNEDGSFTIVAKGINASGNEEIVKEKIYILDLDLPIPPIIHASDTNYPTLTVQGIKLNSEVTVDYDKGEDLKHYYSIDNGDSWKIYTGGIKIESGKILAKSIKSSGLEIQSEATVKTADDALPKAAYDGNIDTLAILKARNPAPYYRINIDPTLWNKTISAKFYLPEASSEVAVSLEDENGTRNNITFTKKDNLLLKDIYITPGITYLTVHSIFSIYNQKDCGIYELVLPENSEEEYNQALQNYKTPSVNIDNMDWTNTKKVTIDYGQNQLLNEYSLDGGKTWNCYKAPFTLENNPVTILMRVMDGTKHLAYSSYKVTKLDTIPKISGIKFELKGTKYPILKATGVEVPSTVTIDFDLKDGTENYYSLDGTNWQTYTGPFETTALKIWAKSVRTISQLSSQTNNNVDSALPSDALKTYVYDGVLTSSQTIEQQTGAFRIDIDSSLWDKNIVGKYGIAQYFSLVATMYNENGGYLNQVEYRGPFYDEKELKIISGTQYITFHTPVYIYGKAKCNLYELYVPASEE